MNEKRLLILVTVLVVALVGMIGVQAYHLQQLNDKVAQIQTGVVPPSGSSQAPSVTPVNPPPASAPPMASSSGVSPNRRGSTPRAPLSPSLDDFWLSSRFGADDWNPFEEIRRMQEQMDRMFSSTLNQFMASPVFSGLDADPFFLPDLDLREEEDRYVATLDLPGLDQSLVNIEVDGQTLTVSGERDETIKEEDDQGRMIRQERRVGHFERRLALPGPVDKDKVDAHYDNGVLTITLPKAESAPQARKVPLNSGNPTPSS